MDLLQPVLDLFRYAGDLLRHFAPFLAPLAKVLGPLIQVLAPVFLAFRVAVWAGRWARRLFYVRRRQWPLRVVVRSYAAQWESEPPPRLRLTVAFTVKPLATPAEVHTAALVYTLDSSTPILRATALPNPSTSGGVVGRPFVTKNPPRTFTEVFEAPVEPGAMKATITATLVLETGSRACVATLPARTVARPGDVAAEPAQATQTEGPTKGGEEG